jgi:hypothetical protein
LHLYILALSFSGLEEFVFSKMHVARNDIGGEDLDFGVEVTNVTIVEPAAGHDFVFSIRNFIL